MNNLNSVLIEGTVSGGFSVAGEGRKEHCSFTVSSLRYFKDKTGVERQETLVRTVIRKVELIKAAKLLCCDGRGLRAVGRLACDDEGLYVEAEHVEYRPRHYDQE